MPTLLPKTKKRTRVVQGRKTI
uniref:Uncharacterized protein n=1 Tax=Rhizophora mucronata TaxID=61149 RepID=A0A2P2PB91_RHIMU